MYTHELSYKRKHTVDKQGGTAAWFFCALQGLVLILWWPSGYVVLRFCCKHKEARRQRMYAKALDSLAMAPYAHGVTRFVLAGVPCLSHSVSSRAFRVAGVQDCKLCDAGIGSGARAAAAVSTRCSREIAGLLLLAYPLQARTRCPFTLNLVPTPGKWR